MHTVKRRLCKDLVKKKGEGQRAPKKQARNIPRLCTGVWQPAYLITASTTKFSTNNPVETHKMG